MESRQANGILRAVFSSTTVPPHSPACLQIGRRLRAALHTVDPLNLLQSRLQASLPNSTFSCITSELEIGHGGTRIIEIDKHYQPGFSHLESQLSHIYQQITDCSVLGSPSAFFTFSWGLLFLPMDKNGQKIPSCADLKSRGGNIGLQSAFQN